MPASAFLDHPVLKVSRPVAACLRCRTAKIKCDGKLPACSACEKADKAKSCSGATDEFAKGKERSYVASLEGYCEKLEKRLAEVQRRRSALDSNAAPGQEMPPHGSITAFAVETSSSRAHHKEVNDIDDLVGDFGFLSVNATSRDFLGLTSNVSFAQLLLTLSTVKPLPDPSSQSLPSRQEATRLIQHYFDNVLIQLPLFTETTLWTSVEVVYQDGGRFAKPIDRWFVYMVIAIASASLWHQQPSQNQQLSRSMVSTALSFAGEVLQPGSSVGVQAILLLAQYSLFDPEHYRPRFLVFFAARVMVDLGLHHDPPSEVIVHKDRLEQRRRLFYSLYTMDRIVCISLGHSFSFSDLSVEVGLPAVRVIPGSPSHEPVFMNQSDCAIHLIKIRRILSEAYQQMYFNGRDPVPHALARTWKFCADARDWYANAPETTKSSFGLLYRLELLYCTIVFLSPSFGDPNICDFSRVLLLDRCVDYISQLHQALEQPSSLPFFNVVDIHRARQIGDRLVKILDESFDLLMSNELPEPPAVPPGTPDPPYLAEEDRINCRARVARCLHYIIDILNHGSTRWNLRDELAQFLRDSSGVRQRLPTNTELSSYTGFQTPLLMYTSQEIHQSTQQPYISPGSDARDIWSIYRAQVLDFNQPLGIHTPQKRQRSKAKKDNNVGNCKRHMIGNWDYIDRSFSIHDFEHTRDSVVSDASSFVSPPILHLHWNNLQASTRLVPFIQTYCGLITHCMVYLAQLTYRIICVKRLTTLNMLYFSFLPSIVALALCFTPSRPSDEAMSNRVNQLVSSSETNYTKHIQDGSSHLIHDIRACGQFLSGIYTLSWDESSNTSFLAFVNTCDRVVTVLDKVVERSTHLRIQSRNQHELQSPTVSDWSYLNKMDAHEEISILKRGDRTTSDGIVPTPKELRSRHPIGPKYPREEICEAKVCEGGGFENICNMRELDQNAAAICRMCYPEKNMRLISAHCQAKWRRERKAFYIISFALIAITLMSGLVLCIRRRYLRAKNPQGDDFMAGESGINPPGELYYYDGPRSILPPQRSSSLAVNCSSERNRQGPSAKYDNSWDDGEAGVISTSAAHRRLRQLGILSRTGRKRIHDLFDLETLQSKRDATKSSQRKSEEKERIPVMPWAPNASVRSSHRSSSRARATRDLESSAGVEVKNPV